MGLSQTKNSEICSNIETLHKVNKILKKQILTLEEQLKVKERIIQDKEQYINILLNTEDTQPKQAKQVG